jgi:predicted RNA-binding Zn ribbon-like protein
MASPSRPPAPGSLALVQAFVNTNDIEAGTDRLAEWLESEGLTTRDVAALQRDREAIRELIAANAGRPVDAEAEAALERMTASIRPWAALVDGRVELTGGGDALTTVLLAVAEATATGAFGRLRICDNDACRWAFYDGTKNGRSRWCHPAVCGNRAHTRAYRERRRA